MRRWGLTARRGQGNGSTVPRMLNYDALKERRYVLIGHCLAGRVPVFSLHLHFSFFTSFRLCSSPLTAPANQKAPPCSFMRLWHRAPGMSTHYLPASIFPSTANVV